MTSLPAALMAADRLTVMIMPAGMMVAEAKGRHAIHCVLGFAIAVIAFHIWA